MLLINYLCYNYCKGYGVMMAIKTSTFGHVELSGEEAVWFIKHINEDKPNQKAQEAYEHGLILLRKMQSKYKATNNSRKEL